MDGVGEGQDAVVDGQDPEHPVLLPVSQLQLGAPTSVKERMNERSRRVPRSYRQIQIGFHHVVKIFPLFPVLSLFSPYF